MLIIMFSTSHLIRLAYSLDEVIIATHLCAHEVRDSIPGVSQLDSRLLEFLFIKTWPEKVGYANYALAKLC